MSHFYLLRTIEHLLYIHFIMNETIFRKQITLLIGDSRQHILTLIILKAEQ